jgi:ABC-type phosphate transport system substrate-binding protein
MSRLPLALCVLAAATTASAESNPYHRLTLPSQAGARTKLHIDGSTTLGPITECMEIYFQQVQPKVDIVIPDVHGWPGSSAGIRGLAEDTPVHPTIDADDGLEVVADIAQSSRNLGASDFARMPFGSELTAHEVAKDALAIIVHPNNDIANMSITNNGAGLGDVVKVYKGDITSWFALGGDCPGDQIHVYSRNTNSGTLFSFIDLYSLPAGYNPGFAPNGPDDKWVAGTTYVEDARDIVDAVAADECGIGFAGLGNSQGAAPVKAIGIQKGEIGGFPAVLPSKATARSGEFPGSRALWYVTRLEPSITNVRGKFLDFVYSRTGQRIVEATGFVSVYQVVDGPEEVSCPNAN